MTLTGLLIATQSGLVLVSKIPDDYPLRVEQRRV